MNRYRVGTPVLRQRTRRKGVGVELYVSSDLRVMKRIRVTVVCLLALVFLVSQQAKAVGDEPDLSCSFHAGILEPSIPWKRLKKGDVLTNDAAILTCESAKVQLKSNTPLHGYAIDWDPVGQAFIATITDTNVFLIQHKSSEAYKDVKVEILAVSGQAFYSTAPQAKRSIDFVSFSSLVVSTSKEKKRVSQIREMGWSQVSAGTVLGPWDMIRVQQNGSVVLEVLEPGTHRLLNESTVVRDRNGEYTNNERLPANSYLVLIPEFYQKVLVRAVSGEVLRATDKEKVRRFWEEHEEFLRIER